MSEMVAFGKFRILAKKFSRGSWTVHEATEVQLDRPVELRTYSNRLPKDSEFEKQFIATLTRIAGFDHPHIGNVLDLGVVMERGYYTTSPRDAVPLAEAFPEKLLDGIPEDQLIQHAVGLVAALETMHSAGFVHGALGPDAIYWDKKRCFPYITWFPIRAKNGDEFRFTLPPVPAGFEGNAADLFRMAGVVHQMLTGTAPLADPGAVGTTAAVNVPGGIEGVYEVLSQALAVDPAAAFPDAASMRAALEKTLGKHRVRLELEKSVSSMVIPQEVLEAALAKKREQKKRQRAEQGVTPAEAPYVSPLEGPGGAPALKIAGGLMVVGLLAAPFLWGEAPPPPPPPPPTTRPPPTLRPVATRPATGSAPATGTTSTPAAPASGLAALKDAGPTGEDNFLDRWNTVKTWILALPPAKRKNPFSYGNLVQLRSEFKRDAIGACQKLDDLIKQGIAESN